MKIVKYIIIILILYSCSKSKIDLGEYENKVITFEKGFIHDSILEELQYFTYEYIQTDSIAKHSYKLDSIYYVRDSFQINMNSLNNYKYTVLYYQSINKDTLYSNYYKDDTVLTNESWYVLIDSLAIIDTGFYFKIYKYEIPNPPCDGDLTLFFNERLGLIERYNRGWQNRFTIVDDIRYRSRLALIVSEMKMHQDFYYKLNPPPPSDMKKFDSLVECKK